MQILFDENILYGNEAFSLLGDVRSCAGRDMKPEMVGNVDLLFVRSVTKVNRSLLAGCRVKFVATATSGSDHIDTEFLAGAGITFSDAIGSNANSTAEYVVAALLTLGARRGFSLAGKSIGVIGVGHVGSLVVEKARALGMTVLRNDPPRQRKEPDFKGVSLDEALAADVVSLHVPLTQDGPDPTFHLVDAARLERLKRDTILIQSSRGAVVDTGALKHILKEKRGLMCALDVWEDEPDIDAELLELADIGTPHIAGYSWTSKVEATRLVYEAACRFLGQEPAWAPPLLPGGHEAPVISLEDAPPAVEATVKIAVDGVYDIVADDRRMRGMLAFEKNEHGAYFDSLRKSYPTRLEFLQARLTDVPDAAICVLGGIGFRTASTSCL